MTPKITVLFYSTYGTNHGVALEAARAAEAAGAEVRLRRCKETAPIEVVNGQDAVSYTHLTLPTSDLV